MYVYIHIYFINFICNCVFYVKTFLLICSSELLYLLSTFVLALYIFYLLYIHICIYIYTFICFPLSASTVLRLFSILFTTFVAVDVPLPPHQFVYLRKYMEVSHSVVARQSAAVIYEILWLYMRPILSLYDKPPWCWRAFPLECQSADNR